MDTVDSVASSAEEGEWGMRCETAVAEFVMEGPH